ncbi:heparinase II/III domain-containing protein [Haloplasma contractile]|uniref:Heparinase II/III-like protein n=1 Tax=Haloplasma contractile SSD-17B TaxID=1033810 RepID=F7PVA3_9MOLU|nr:heparinase II/III family protein [Haloplasma contractile]ERJ12932.1 Heparinase II/III-like protein [Haloplasma contractile SSD-17B]
MRQIKLFDLYPEQNLEKLNWYGDQLLKNKIFVANHLMSPNYYHGIWNDRENGRDFLFKLHAFVPVSYLLSLYEKTKKERYFYKAYELFEKWVNHHDQSTSITLHDHVIALRLFVLTKLLTTTMQVDTMKGDQVNRIITIMEDHCNRLLEQDVYSKRHNHGLDQDIALYMASFVLMYCLKSPNCQSFKKVAKKRIKLQLDYLIQDDGSYSEHAPKYAVIVYKRLQAFQLFLKDYTKDRRLERYVNQKLVKLHLYIRYMLQPDNKIPPISDSDSTEVDLKSLLNPSQLDKSSFFKKIILNTGFFSQKLDHNLLRTSRLQSDYFFENGNMVVSSNLRHRNFVPLKLWFYSSFNTRVHKHHDDLAFMLYYKDRPVFLDAGKYNYNYSDPYRILVQSGYGHNTVRVNNCDPILSRNDVKKSKLCDFAYDDTIMFSCGMHTLYDQVIHKRIMLFIKPATVLLIDEILSEETVSIEQIFNLTPTLDYNVRDHCITGVEKDNFIFQMTRLYMNTNATLNAYYGNKDPYIGWYSKRHNQIEPCNTFIFKSKGKHHKSIRSISFVKKDVKVELKQWNKNKITIEAKGNTFLIENDGTRHTLSINGRKLRHKHTLNKLLETPL